MTDAEMLTILKQDLQISTAAYDSRLNYMLNAAKEYIAREGITLDLSDVGDCFLTIMYAGYLYRGRREDKNGGMPRMLRYNLNNRLIAEKGAAPNG